MSGISPDGRRDIICRCSGTTTAQISKLAAQGVVDLDSLSRATGACSGCGACDTDILALLEKYAAQASSDPLQSAAAARAASGA
jgi:bacterioferritin-associated ferredoxin